MYLPAGECDQAFHRLRYTYRGAKMNTALQGTVVSGTHPLGSAKLPSDDSNIHTMKPRT